jgi:hypothetical protein
VPPSLFIQGDVLRALAEAPGSGHAVEMVDPLHTESLLVKVRIGGTVEVDGRPTSPAGLRAALEALRARGGIVSYTRESPELEPSESDLVVIRSVLSLITELRLPVRMITEVRPPPPA